MSNIRSAFRGLALAAISLSAAAPAALAGGPVSVAAPTTANSLGPLRIAGMSIKNFGVVDGHIFRGAQPAKDEYAQLAALGIKTVVDLRDDAKSDSRQLAEAAGLKYINIPVVDHGTPTDAQSLAFVKAVTDPANGKVFTHCAGGRHRTGSMVAVYRMAVDGWSEQQAYDEMLGYDFYTSNGHGGFKTYVEDYYQRMTSNPASVPVAFKAPAPASITAAASH